MRTHTDRLAKVVKVKPFKRQNYRSTFLSYNLTCVYIPIRHSDRYYNIARSCKNKALAGRKGNLRFLFVLDAFPICYIQNTTTSISNYHALCEYQRQLCALRSLQSNPRGTTTILHYLETMTCNLSTFVNVNHVAICLMVYGLCPKSYLRLIKK